MARVINKEIDFFRKSELLKEDLVSRYDFNFVDAFKTTDVDRISFLTHDTIYFFLKRNNVIVTDDDVLAIIRRIDIEGEGKITYSAFVDAIIPQDPYYKAIKTPKQSTINIEYPRSASPARKTAISSFYSPNKKLTNIDYFDYLNESTKKSLNKTLSKFNPSGSRAFSPLRNSDKNDDKGLNIRDLDNNISLTKSTYATPTKKSGLVSPSRLSSSKKIPTSPMKGNEEQHLALTLKDQIDNEKVLETLKNEIALKTDFNTLDAFRFFDISGKGYITRGELEEGLRQFTVFATNTELFLIMRKYDIDGDSLLKYFS